MVRHATKDDIKEIISLRQEVLGNNDNYINFYNREVFDYRYSLVDIYQDNIEGVVDVIPHSIFLNGKKIKVFRVKGIAVRNSNQKNNILKELIDAVIEMSNRLALVSIIDAGEMITYDNYSFRPTYSFKEYTFDSSEFPRYKTDGVKPEYDINDLKDLYYRFLNHFHGYYVLEDNRYPNYIKYLDSQKGLIYSYYRKDKLMGYFGCILSSDQVYIDEIMYEDGEALAKMLSYASTLRNKVVVRTSSFERLEKIIPFAKEVTKVQTFSRINDVRLFRKSYRLSDIQSIESAFDIKPLYLHEYY